MKQILSLTLLLVVLFSQCKKKDDPIPQTGPIKEIDVIDLSIDGVDAKNVSVGEDLIVIRLPEGYTGGDYIKPHFTFGVGYSTRSELVNGFSYEGKELSLGLDNAVRGARTFKIFVIPNKPIILPEPVRDHQITLGPDAGIKVPVTFHGTTLTVNDSGKIVQNPIVMLKNQVTGRLAYWLHPEIDTPEGVKTLKVSFPATIASGNYTAEIVWGSKSEVLSRNVTIHTGAVQLRRDRWYMVQPSRYFELTGFNISKESKYEITISNDHTTPRKIPMHFKNAGILTGSLPADMETGNYKATYWQDGKVIEPYDEKLGVDKYIGDDQFYIKKVSDQPLLRIISQPSRAKAFQNEMGIALGYYPSFVDISRKEPLIAYRQRSGAFPNRNDLVLVNAQSQKEYTVPYSNSVYVIFGGFISFLAYNIPDQVPAGKYEAYIVTEFDKTEKYSQFINILANQERHPALNCIIPKKANAYRNTATVLRTHETADARGACFAGECEPFQCETAHVSEQDDAL